MALPPYNYFKFLPLQNVYLPYSTQLLCKDAVMVQQSTRLKQFSHVHHLHVCCADREHSTPFFLVTVVVSSTSYSWKPTNTHTASPLNLHFQCCFTSTETVGTLRDGSPGPPPVWHSSWAPISFKRQPQHQRQDAILCATSSKVGVLPDKAK